MDEIKDKIILAVKKAIENYAKPVDCTYDIFEIDCDDVDHIAEQIADALIAAGLKFDTVICHTAEFNHLYAARMTELEQRLASAAHRAEVAERALFYANIGRRCDECPLSECSAEIRGSQECLDAICAEYKRKAARVIEEEAKKMTILKIDRTTNVATVTVELSKQDLNWLQHLVCQYSKTEKTSAEFEEFHREIVHLYDYVKGGVIDGCSIKILNNIQDKIKAYQAEEKK